MPIDSLSEWKSEFSSLPKVADESWKANLANYISGHISNELNLQTYAPQVTFSFNTAAFESALAGIDAASGGGVAAIAQGFSDGVQGGLIVAPGTAFGSATPAETFSVVNSAQFDAASLSAAQSKISELQSAAPVSDSNNSLFPVKLREAVLLLTATVSGQDSTPPPTGPLPLTDSNRAVE